VLPRCSYLLDEVAVHGPATPVRDGQVLDVLPPFAGG
jgi:molybdopterin converting factor small subunit